MIVADNTTHSIWRRLMFISALLGLLIFYFHQLPISHYLGLLSYSLFFIACLTLWKNKKQSLILSLLWLVLILLSLVLEAKGMQLSKEINTAMVAMKLMVASTLLQNIVISIYLFVGFLLLLREPNHFTRLLGVITGIAIAVKIVPAIWFSLGFIADTFL